MVNMVKLDIIKSFDQKRVLLIGDTILDVYVYGKAVCLNFDAPTPEAEEIQVGEFFGGVSLVAKNILELGGSIFFVSVVGDDADAKKYDIFTHPKLEKIFLVDKARKTTVKRRFWVDGYKLVQMNQVTNDDINEILEKEIIKKIEPLIGQIDVIVVSDNQHGLLTKNLISQLINLAKKYQKPLYVDCQVRHRSSHHHFYQGADCLFLDQEEVEAASPSFDTTKPEALLKETKKKLVVSNLVVKLGSRGSIALFGDKYIQSPSYKVEAVDTCGAGDAFLAAFSLGDRDSPEESLAIANAWAALSTTLKGTAIPKKQDLINIINSK